jgi:hypothetical protein
MGDSKDGTDVSENSAAEQQGTEQREPRVIDRSRALTLGVNVDPAMRQSLAALRSLSADPAIRQTIEGMRSIKMDPIVRELMAISAAQREMARAVLGPLDEFWRSSAFEELKRTAFEASAAMNAIREQFRQPEVLETMRLFARMREEMGSAPAPLVLQGAELQRTIASMRTAWFDTTNSVQSMRGFAELQGIGAALRLAPAFDEELTGNLRSLLGDWRERIVVPQDILENLGARSSFYEERGLDPALTAFPADAFDEAIDIAELSSPAPILIEDYTITARDAEEEAGFERTNEAHDRLLRFETMVRRFIDECMTRAFGEHWTDSRLSDDMRQAWAEKRRRAEEKGERRLPLIAYADFTDYEKIIIKKENWNMAFKPVFRRMEFVTESFQRLYPIRLCTMHARLITADDQIYLFVEVKRFLRAIAALKE